MQERLSNLAAAAGPVGATVAGVLLIILGVLIVVYPGLLVWLVGLGLVLAGVALLAATFTAAGGRTAGPADRRRSAPAAGRQLPR